MNATLNVTIDATLDELAELQRQLAEFAEQQEWPADLAYQVELVVEELCVNVVSYGTDDSSHAIELRLESTPETLTIDIIDDGRAFDPFTEAPPPDLDSSVEERPIGGLGVHFVKTMMDNVQYRRDEGRNHVTLHKKRSS